MAVLLMALVTPLFAQQADAVNVDVTKLNPEQLRVYQQLKAMQNQTGNSLSLDNLTPETVNKYAQMGKGIGVAVNEGLGAVTKNVEQFSQTGAGKWLMVLITWKVMGEDAIGLTRTLVQWSVGGLLLFIGIPFWMWIIRRNCVQRPIVKIEKSGFWKKNIVYSDRNPIHDEWTLAYGACFLVYLAVTVLILFVH